MTFAPEIADHSAARSTRPGGPKPLFVRGLLAALSTTAAVGIYAVLAGDFNETGVRVLTSTLVIGLYCVLCLANLAVLGTRFRGIGRAGIAVASVALAIGLGLIWSTREDYWDDSWLYLFRAFLICGIVAFALAHAALLLRIDLAGSDAVAALRAAALTTMSLVALLLIAPVVHQEVGDNGVYWRLLGTLAILDALGTVCLPVLARFGTQSQTRIAR